MRQIDFTTLSGTTSSIYVLLFVLLGIFWLRNRDIEAAFWWALFPLFQIASSIISTDIKGFDNELLTYVGNFFIFLSGISLVVGFVKFTKRPFSFIILYSYGAVVLFVFLLQFAIDVGFEARVTTVSWTTIISTTLCIIVLFRFKENHYNFEKRFIIFWSLVKLFSIFYRIVYGLSFPNDPATTLSLNLLTLVSLSQIFLTVGLILLSLAQRNQQIESEHKRSIDLQSSLDTALEKAKKAAAEKNTFLNSMEVKLKTPLNEIINYSENLKLKSYGGLNEEQSKYADNIREGSIFLRSLLSNLLESSDKGQGDKK